MFLFLFFLFSFRSFLASFSVFQFAKRTRGESDGENEKKVVAVLIITIKQLERQQQTNKHAKCIQHHHEQNLSISTVYSDRAR